MASPSRQPPRPHLLLVTDSADPSGVGRHMLALAAGLVDAHHVSLAFADGAGGFAQAARAAGLRARLYSPGNEAALVAAERPDLLHVHAGIGWEGQALALAGAAAGVPVIRTEHLPWLVTDPAQEATYAGAAQAVDAFVAVSEAAASSWRPALARLRPGARLATIRNGVSPLVPAQDRAATRAALGLAEDAPLLLCIGRFTPQKDQPNLLGALRLLTAQGLRPELLFVGEGPERAACEAEAQGLPGVRFLGWREDVAELMAAADVLVLPSRFEGLPLVVLEAMALGLPVAATRVGGAEEALGPDHPFLAAPGDPASLAAAVAAALAAPRAQVAAAQRGRFEAEFTAARMIDRTATLYRSVLRKAHRWKGKTKMTRLRLGFIGAGGIAQRHLSVLETFDDVAVVGVADPDAGRAAAAAARTGARAFASQDDMIAELNLGALWICVPPFAHGAPERAALAAGLPFFVEKPLSLDADLVDEIEAAVAQSGLVTAVGYHWRYLDTVDEARRLLADNPPHLMSGYWLDQTPPPDWWRQADRSGGQMVEQATHVVDLARFLAGDVVEVFGLAAYRDRPDFPGTDVATASTAALRFASGAIANLSATCLLRWSHRIGLHVFADGLALELTDHDIMVDTGRGRPVRAAEGDPVWRQDRAFVDAVLGRENRIRAPYAEAARSHRTALAIARSARLGAPVRMEGLRADPQPVFRPAAADRAHVA